jgi:hypothetical protein
VRNRWESMVRWFGGQKHESFHVYKYNGRGRYEPEQEQSWECRDCRRVSQVTPANLGSRDATTRGDPVALDCSVPGGERTRENNSSRVSDTIILVGMITCLVSTEEKSVDGHRELVPFMADQKRMLGQDGWSFETERKRTRLTVNAGWVVVGPGYSEEPAVHASGETRNRVT